LAFAKAQARKMLDAPAEDSVAGLRDRRAEIAALKVGDLHQNRGYDSLRVVRKGGRRDALAINPQTAARLRAYLDLAGHGADLDGPLFRPLRPNGKRQEEHRPMDPDAIDRVVRKFATVGLDRGYSAHSMRATFITTARSKTAPSSKMCKRPPVAAPGGRNESAAGFHSAIHLGWRRVRAVLLPQ
jgi:integrase/recombinase XerD